ncbi:MAG: transcription elongation factor GreA [Candidatus Niyogibacteria bacterium CG10_big_fil_rev_8_21_14_0_10_46_36]|uniref:Transcription elongation factor GreA n=1 Tax=Candidatus Niyogibacteria bacterium CG10_big_fil_rev_8_21_14_0_10_46_36 TaxID=1974726 RepID=A0A2H0TE92_9BACT|nr:MAG: transcription elongation factor GreA [Candidatus Niyogibacteria bacterium CG10_big_fil_rev_8_21_14_0_10_46_36]
MEILSDNQKEDSNFEYLSEAGFKRLKQELENLRTEKRQEIAKRLEYAKSLGDLSENSEYAEAKTMQENNEARIAELEDKLSRTVLIQKAVSTFDVAIGSTIVVKRHDTGATLEYTVVGSEEADPVSRKISNESPMGRAFLGAKKGQTVKVSTPGGAVDYTVVDIV